MTTKRNARLAGVCYLVLAISGMLGFLLVRSRLFEPGDAMATAANLVQQPGLARAGIAADLTIVVAQALTALYLYRLFRRVDRFSAGSLAAFGFMNSVTILVATVFSATALQVALDGTVAAGGPSTVLLLYELNDASWAVGSLFFGLWLVPMGWLVLRSGFMPRPMGWFLVVGGIGYLASAYLHFLLPDAGPITELLMVPASIGELWMVAYLLVRGVRPGSEAPRAPSGVGQYATGAVSQ